MKSTTDSEEVVKRILTLVNDLLDNPTEAKEWMKTPRAFWKGRNAIEMINENKLYAVMQYIERTLF